MGDFRTRVGLSAGRRTLRNKRILPDNVKSQSDHSKTIYVISKHYTTRLVVSREHVTRTVRIQRSVFTQRATRDFASTRREQDFFRRKDFSGTRTMDVTANCTSHACETRTETNRFTLRTYPSVYRRMVRRTKERERETR